MNEIPIQRIQGEDNVHQHFYRVYNLVAKTRFKYKSMIQQGEMRIVSQIYQKENSSKENALPSFKLLTYTSKNEFYVI